MNDDANIISGKINPTTPERNVVLSLIAMHQRTLARIESGERFQKHFRDVTDEIHAAALHEIEQCRMALDALRRMNTGDFKEASKILSQIKEYIPYDH